MDCNRSEEEVEKQTENQLIESSVKRALECLNISANEWPIGDQKADNCVDTNGQHIDEQTIGTTDETNSEVQYLCTESVTDIYKRIKTETNSESEIESEEQIQTEDNESNDESVAQTDASDQSCHEMSTSDGNHVNAVLVESLDKPKPNRYPLKHRWQLWFWRADPGVKVVWHQALQQVCKPFDTIENFWRLYHHIVCVQQLVPPSDYCVFKEGIKPMWEDMDNINGGKWVMEFAKVNGRESNPLIDQIWLEVLLCLIGEGFNEFGDEICGAVVNVRSKGRDRISVWTRNANKSLANLKIGEILKMRTRFEGKLIYEAHSTSQKIAEAKDRLFDIKLNTTPKQPKPTRRSCIF